jgi:hypothetical protein
VEADACRPLELKVADSQIGSLLDARSRIVQKAILVGETVVLRYDPARPREQRAVQIWHQGKQIQIARRVDTYANCFVRRDHTTKELHPSEPADAPPPGMRLRDFGSAEGQPQAGGDNEEGIF